jgi:hypothetical protein
VKKAPQVGEAGMDKNSISDSQASPLGSSNLGRSKTQVAVQALKDTLNRTATDEATRQRVSRSMARLLTAKQGS